MKTLVKKLKKLLNKKIIDIIIFGSYVKGNNRSKDIDIIILSEKYDKEIKEQIKQIVEKADIQFLSIKDYDKFIWLSMIKEGFSVKRNKYLFNIYNIKPVKLFKYSLKELTVSKKVMFDRAIKNFEKIQKLSNRVVLVPINQSSEFEEFLRNWNIDIDSEEYELLPVLRKEII
ncbi:hypothetical protein HN415_09730 [Candidatus Woesearchaeota archaeon]|jgi:predicted nucleotidyltransferase|nr:hypothetical protein [Candidatus Woesearchaeota archaeon]